MDLDRQAHDRRSVSSTSVTFWRDPSQLVESTLPWRESADMALAWQSLLPLFCLFWAADFNLAAAFKVRGGDGEAARGTRWQMHHPLSVSLSALSAA